MPNVKVLAINQEPEPIWSKTQQRLLDVLECEENRQKSLREICRLAGYHPPVWYQAIQDANFILAIEALGVRVRRNKLFWKSFNMKELPGRLHACFG
jgi:hypothetical protein